jgi:hypothetical protein
MEQLAPDLRRQLITRVANELVREAVAKGQTATLEVVGHSMWPLLRSGDVVTVTQVAPAELRPGILVVCMMNNGGFLAHRLLAVLPDGRLLTRGDARRNPDPPWPPHSLVGRVVAAQRAGRPLRLDRRWPIWAGRARAWGTAAYRALRRAAKALCARYALLLLAFLCGYPLLSIHAAVTLLYFTAEPQPDAILLRWETASELNSSAFRIYRALAATGPWDTWIHQQPAVGDLVGATYQYRDLDVMPGITYYYLLEEIEADDSRVRYIDKIASAAIGQPATATLTASPTTTLTPTPSATPVPTATASATQTPKPHLQPTATRRYTNTPPPPEGDQHSPVPSVATAAIRPSPAFFPPAWVATPTSPALAPEVEPATATPAQPAAWPATPPSPAPASLAIAPTPTGTPPQRSFLPALTRPSGVGEQATQPPIRSYSEGRGEGAILSFTSTPAPLHTAQPARAPKLILALGSGALGGAALLGFAVLRLSRRGRVGP